MNTDYTCFTYNSLELIHGIARNTKWRDRMVGCIVNNDAWANAPATHPAPSAPSCHLNRDMWSAPALPFFAAGN